MGYNATDVDRGFTIPAENIPAALAAVNAIGGEEFRSLPEALAELTCFECCEVDEHGFSLGWHRNDHYYDLTEKILAAMAPYADNGSFVRFVGEDQCLWGFQVVDGRLRGESAVWTLDPEKPATTQSA